MLEEEEERPNSMKRRGGGREGSRQGNRKQVQVHLPGRAMKTKDPFESSSSLGSSNQLNIEHGEVEVSGREEEEKEIKLHKK